MTLATILKQVEKIAADNSPLILTAIGVTGTITTAYLTGKATFKYTKHLAEEGYYDRDYKFVRTPKEHVKSAWKMYIPAASSCAVTVACIIGANRIGTRRAAAMAAAYKVSEKAFTEYREKIVDKIGENRERAARDEMAQDRVNENPVNSREIIITGGGDVLCYEPFTGRYFHSDMETLKKAQNDLNYQINNNYYASLSEFYDLIGLARTSYSDEVGWNSDELLELTFSTVLSDDGRPCLSLEYKVVPIRDYSRVN